MSDKDSDSDANIPPREVCERRCQEFAAVTGTDSALAMFFLQDRDWQLEVCGKSLKMPIKKYKPTFSGLGK